jgi:hypothetical protein
MAAVGVDPMDQAMITDADVARSRADPRFKQILLAKVLEQLLGTLHRLQHKSDHSDAVAVQHLREGALVAVKLADIIHAIDDKLRVAPGVP